MATSYLILIHGALGVEGPQRARHVNSYSYGRSVHVLSAVTLAILSRSFISTNPKCFNFFNSNLTLPSKNHQYHQIDQESYSRREKKFPRNHQVVSIMQGIC
jgi:hypothetical protein